MQVLPTVYVLCAGARPTVGEPGVCIECGSSEWMNVSISGGSGDEVAGDSFVDRDARGFIG